MKVPDWSYAICVWIIIIPSYNITKWSQWILWKCGKPWHNKWFCECTPDFNCCCGENAPNATEEQREEYRQERMEKQFIASW